MHPALDRMRPAQDRALHLLNLELGALDTDGWPSFPYGAQRDNMELAAREKARLLLEDHDMRVWLAHIEAEQKTAALQALADTAPDLAGLVEPSTDGPPQPDNAATLHQLVALAHHIQRTNPT